jgi:hypothetical protein
MLGDLFSKLDANDSTDTGFSFSVAHTSVERQSLVFLHTSPQKAVGTYIYIYIYIYGGPRCEPGCQFTNFHEKFKMKLNVNLDNLLPLKCFNLTLE